MDAVENVSPFPVVQEWLNFVSSIVASLSWPITLLIFFVLLRRPIERILRDVSRLKIGNVELEVVREAKELVSEAVSAGITVMYPSAPNSQYTVGSLREVVVSQWIEIEEILDKLWRQRIPALPAQRYTAVSQKIDDLRRSGVIGSELASLLVRIKRLRNDLVHSNEISFPDEDRMATLGAIKSVKERLQQALSKQG